MEILANEILHGKGNSLNSKHTYYPKCGKKISIIALSKNEEDTDFEGRWVRRI